MIARNSGRRSSNEASVVKDMQMNVMIFMFNMNLEENGYHALGGVGLLQRVQPTSCGFGPPVNVGQI